MKETRHDNENNKANNIFSLSSSVFKKLHWIYLIAYTFTQGMIECIYLIKIIFCIKIQRVTAYQEHIDMLFWLVII